MTWDNFRQAKEDLFQQLLGLSESGEGAAFESVSELKPKQRLSVGYSKVNEGDSGYRAELFVYREMGEAYDAAAEFESMYPEEARVTIVEAPRIPSKSDIPKKEAHRTLTQKQRCLHAGISVGHVDGYPGSLGGFVNTEDGVGFVSNNHVLALLDKAKDNSSIFHPTRHDPGKFSDKNEIGTLWGRVPIGTHENRFDCAIALLKQGSRFFHRGNRIPSGFDLAGKYLGLLGSDLKDIPVGTIVAKLGRTTGLTYGRVYALGLDLLEVRSPGQGSLYFDDVIAIEPMTGPEFFTKPGDSGSVVFTADTCEAFGLHFAAAPAKLSGDEGKSTILSYSCNLRGALEQLDATWLEDHADHGGTRA